MGETVLNYLPMAKLPTNTVDGHLLGVNVLRLRTDRDWSRSHLEKLADLSAGYILRIEGGQHPRPTMRTAKKLAKAFGVSVEVLAGEMTEEATTNALQGLEAELWEMAHKRFSGKQAELLYEAWRNTLHASAGGQELIRQYAEFLKSKYAPPDIQMRVNEENVEYNTSNEG